MSLRSGGSCDPLQSNQTPYLLYCTNFHTVSSGGTVAATLRVGQPQQLPLLQRATHALQQRRDGGADSGEIDVQPLLCFRVRRLPLASSNSQALLPSIKRDFPSEQIDPEQYFAARLSQNIRVVICTSPSAPLLTEHAQ